MITNSHLKYYIILSIILIFSFLFSIATAENLNMTPVKENTHPKIESALQKIEEEYENSSDAAMEYSLSRNIKIDDEKDITVYLISEPETPVDELTLQPYGAKIIKRGDNVLKIKAPINMLKAIADNAEGVSFIQLPDKPIPLMVESEGVAVTEASFYHTEGYLGSDVKVAVIDLGFSELSSAIIDGDLPNDVVKIDCTGSSCVTTDFSSETERHGTGVAEIVYDMAPEAQLYLIKINDTLDLVDAKNYSINNGIKIINTSLGFFNTNFYDGECWYSNAVCTANNAYDNDILWVSSAGNYANQHYEATFTDSDDDGWHNIYGDVEVISIFANFGDIISVTLTWNAWPVTNQNYDLYLYDSSLNMVDSSSNWQTGSQLPSEYISYFVRATGTYSIAIWKRSANNDHQLEVYSFNHELIPSVASSSLGSPADADGVLTVGAINYINWEFGPQESFSSQGPTNDGRTKPEICGPDGVSNNTYGYYGFYGTSAASPHVAGAAALTLSANPTFSASQLWTSVVSSAIDMGSSGQDNIYGYGRLNLNNCPDDPDKTNPGVCGCGVPDTDTDGDVTMDCNDNCPDDQNKVNPDVCGCGMPDIDTDLDGTFDCDDLCPNDQDKTSPGACGCGATDIDTDGDGTPDCNDTCPTDHNKFGPGICGCGVSETDTDNDGIPDCIDFQFAANITLPASNQKINVGKPVNFQCSLLGGNPPFTYLWKFNGASDNSTQRDPGDVTFLKVGIYTVTLTAEDNDGNIESDTVVITVKEVSNNGDGGGGGGGGFCFVGTLP